ncbi:MAG TPA: RidA family protein [Oscillospiraceae bacterium]|nr:RidA family protein [Oscillospiraceae bacterium]
MNIDKQIEELGIILPKASKPAAAYVQTKISNNLVFISGQMPVLNGEIKYKGKLGQEYTKEEGYAAAKLCGLNLIAQLKDTINNLNRVKQIVHLKGFVASSSDFYEHPYVINGASDLMEEVFGEKGKHTRCALGTNVLPFNVPVEIELIVEIED